MNRIKNTLTLVLVLFFFLNLSAQSEYSVAMDACRNLGYFESKECIVGQSLPIFEGTTIDGYVINNQAIKNKVTVINFWFTACPPCIAKLDGLNKIVEKYNQREDVVFLSFTRDTEEILNEDFFPHHKLDFEIIPNAESLILQTFKSWWGFPTTFIVDKSGKVFKVLSGGKTNAVEASLEAEKTISLLIDECLAK